MPGVIDHPLVREAGRRHGGEMLQAVGGIWATIGNTNLDHRSLAIAGDRWR